MQRGLIALLAVACGAAVGNLYFPQSISPSVASGLGVRPAAATLVVTAVQIGYAAGIFFLVPLGDRIPHKTLILSMFGATAAAMLAASVAPALWALVAASAVAGVSTTSAQVIAPFAAERTAAPRRGAVLGLLLSGSTAGILFGRAVGGAAADLLGWRGVYLAAAAVAVTMAAVLAAAMPRSMPSARPPYGELLAEPLRLLRREPELRRSCFYQSTVFAGFSAVWTSIALLLTGPGYGYTTRAVALLALVDLAVIVGAPLAGHLADRRGPDPVNVFSMLGTLAAAGVLLAGAAGGASGLVALAAGVLLLDLATQSGMVANHTRVFALDPEARSRLNTAYMTCVFLGGATGSWLGARAYVGLGWTGVCGLVAVLAVLGLASHVTFERRRARRALR
jgi:predicted MFS family arabinose efflux permease